MDEMRAAIDTAVMQGHTEVRRLDELCDALADGFADHRSKVVTESEAMTSVYGVMRNLVRTIRRHLDHERDSMNSFNVAFFGRTGAGKSTLLSAFGELNGEYVSPGDSDWTTAINHIDWHGCRLFDTPGINGWGRTESRENLEATARRAVETADIVLLCFDSQSQQAMEFAKIAEWVREFGKPAIAVLNVRNVRWRHPERVAPSRRAHLSESVRQHADNIRTELAGIGLGDTPIVAIQSRRALFARASTPFEGPALEDFTNEREKYGTEYLARWSNFGALEHLISTTIAEGGGDLRLGALREDLRARCLSGATTLEDLSRDLTASAEAHENEVAGLLSVIGYPHDDERHHLTDVGRPTVDWLARSEGLRGSPYTGSTSGSLDRLVQHQLVSHLASPRRTSSDTADQLVKRAFRTGATVDQKAFAAAVFDPTAIQNAVEQVWIARAEFLERELQTTAEQALQESRQALITAAQIGGTNGTHPGANALRGAGIAAGAAAVAVPFAAANFWNPAGWAAGAAAACVGIAGQVQQHYGKKMSQQAQAKARLAHAQAIADSRHAVTQTYENYEQEFEKLSRSKAWELISPVLLNALRASTQLREAAQQAARAADHARTVIDDLHPSRSAADVLRCAQAEIAQSPQQLTRVLLGEDWISSEHQHLDDAPSHEVQELYRRWNNASQIALFRQVSAAWTTSRLSEIRDWAESLEDAAEIDVELRPALTSFRTVTRDRPKFIALGDYNSGKSSLVRRILVDSRLGEPHIEVEIQARPATTLANTYHFPRYSLVDTPGLQSGNTDHDRIARESVASSALVFVVLHVNLLLGNTALLEKISAGSDTMAAKMGRMVFLINRSDELGVDPLTSPRSFLALQDRKREELVAALASRSIIIRPEQVHCLAGDPFGLVGSTPNVSPDAFSEHRCWDGVGSLTDAISSLTDDQLVSASGSAALDAAISELKHLRLETIAARDCHTNEIQQLDLLLATVVTASGDAVVLQRVITQMAERMLGDSLARAAAEIHSVAPDEPKRLAEIVDTWTSDPILGQEVAAYNKDTSRKLHRWLTEHQSTIEREYQAAAVDLGPSPRPQFTPSRTSTTSEVVDGAGKVAGHASEIAKALGSRDAVYAIGKQLGHKFKPWGAVKGGAKVAKVGIVLGAVAAAADAKSMIDDGYRTKNHKADQNDAIAAVDSTREDLLVTLTVGDNKQGPVAILDEVQIDLQTRTADLSTRTEEQRQELTVLDRRIAVIDRLLESAESLTLG